MSFRDHIVTKHVLTLRESESGDCIELKEGVTDFVQRHPYITTMAAGFVLDKTLKAARGHSKIDVATQRMKFYARTSAERRLQKELVDTLIASKHYTLVSSKSEGDAFVWTLKRTGR